MREKQALCSRNFFNVAEYLNMFFHSAMLLQRAPPMEKEFFQVRKETIFNIFFKKLSPFLDKPLKR